jgi:hypothetical protein
MSQGKGHDDNTTPGPYLRQQAAAAARQSLEAALSDAFPVAEELPADFIELARRLNQ